MAAAVATATVGRVVAGAVATVERWFPAARDTVEDRNHERCGAAGGPPVTGPRMQRHGGPGTRAREWGRMASVEIVTIGTEMLLGQSSTRTPCWWPRRSPITVSTSTRSTRSATMPNRLATMLEGVLDRADGAITTGGLGPTVDDLTKDAVAEAVRDTLQLHEPSLEALYERFEARRPMTENNRQQAVLPSRAEVFPNPNGTAPGFVASRARRQVRCVHAGRAARDEPDARRAADPVAVSRFDLRSRDLYEGAAYDRASASRSSTAASKIAVPHAREPEDRDARPRRTRRRQGDGEGREPAPKPTR